MSFVQTNVKWSVFVKKAQLSLVVLMAQSESSTSHKIYPTVTDCLPRCDILCLCRDIWKASGNAKWL